MRPSRFAMAAFAIAALAAQLAAVPVAARQVPAPWPGTWPGSAIGATIGEQHRYEMERLRARSDEQEAFARSHALAARLTVLELQAARQPALPDPARPVSSLEDARAVREREAARRESIVAGVGQIDAWLDRPQP